MKSLLPLFLISLVVVSCNSEDEEIVNTGSTPDNTLTESIIEKGIKYGSESRQFLDIYKAKSECPTPIYFDAHGNGGNTNIPNSTIEDLNNLGVSIIAWESLTTVNTIEEVETGWNDAELMFNWVIENAEKYNLDTSQMIIGGSSRGSIISWKYAHSDNPGIKGLYMYNALPSPIWNNPESWSPIEEVTSDSPPVFFVYNGDFGSSTDPDDPDIHDPVFGRKILDKYIDLEIIDGSTLLYALNETDNTDKYQLLTELINNVIDLCPDDT